MQVELFITARMLQEYDCIGPLIDDTFSDKTVRAVLKVNDLPNLGQT